MKLSLENFRSHQKASFDLPAVGFVKVSAASGRGKSNFFKSIQWSLYGTKGNVIRYGADSCKVAIEINGLSAVRSKNPTLLESGGFVGEAAQQHICTALGMNELEFEVSSYIAQDQVNSFVHCKPIEQMEILQKLAYSNDSPDDLKKRIDVLINDTQKQIDLLSLKRKLDEHGLKIKQEYATKLKEATVKPEAPPIENSDDLKKQKINLENEGIQIKKLIFDNENSLKDPVRTRVEKAKAWLATALESQEKMKQWFEENRETKFEHQAELEETRKIVQHLTEQIKEFDDMMKRIADKKGCERKVSTYSTQLWDTICSAHAAGHENLGANAPDLHALSGKLISAQKDLEKADNKGAYLDDPSEALENAKRLQEELEEKHRAWIGTQAIRSQKKNEALDLNINIKKANDVIETAAGLETEEAINKKLDELREKKEEIQTKHAEIVTTLNNASNINGQWATYKRNTEAIEDAEKEIIELEKTNESTDKEIDVNIARSGKLKRLQALVQKAALSALDARIAEINLRAEHWLEVLFSGAVQATIETEKEQKNGNVSNKINLLIYENGTKIEKKEDLSGGQQSRLALAFQLALSDLYRSPILCLDESLKGCDPETAQICLEAIRQISERKLVLMVEHHIADSQFDQVVTI